MDILADILANLPKPAAAPAAAAPATPPAGTPPTEEVPAGAPPPTGEDGKPLEQKPGGKTIHKYGDQFKQTFGERKA